MHLRYVKKSIDDLKQMGCSYMVVSVLAENNTAIKFWETMGFEYYATQDIDAYAKGEPQTCNNYVFYFYITMINAILNFFSPHRRKRQLIQEIVLNNQVSKLP